MTLAELFSTFGRRGLAVLTAVFDHVEHCPTCGAIDVDDDALPQFRDVGRAFDEDLADIRAEFKRLWP